LRPGQITPAQIEAACGQALASGLSQAAPRASGTLESHYAPNARLELISGSSLQARLQQVRPGTLIGLWSRHAPAQPVSELIWREQPADPAAAAQQLFAVLRELDAHGVQAIWVEQPPHGPAWDGVRDRLQRAAA
jgi:L-threonylcarbamoyladenylate synthase